MAQLVYITAPDLASAEQLAEMLVEQRLAAGVNIVPGAHSVYRWQGAVHRHGEALLLAQTADDRVQALTLAVCAIHGYTTPCVVTCPLSGGNPAFLAWIEASTRVE